MTPEELAEYRKMASIERVEHRASMEVKYGLERHPKARMLYEIAWEMGHSSGFSEVEIYYSQMSELLR
jgi:hypothetical protein